MEDILKKDNFTGINYLEKITTILQAVSWYLSRTVHTTYSYPPRKKVFIGDMIMRIKIAYNLVSKK